MAESTSYLPNSILPFIRSSKYTSWVRGHPEYDYISQTPLQIDYVSHFWPMIYKG